MGEKKGSAGLAKRVPGLAGQLDQDEIRLRIKVVLTGFVDDSIAPIISKYMSFYTRIPRQSVTLQSPTRRSTGVLSME